MESDQNRTRLHGYSERGVVNAVFETIAHHPKGPELLDDLLRHMVLWENRHGISRHGRRDARLVEADIYIEPSLSDFGNPDVLVLACYRKPNDGGESWEAHFIEAKMEPFLMSSPPMKNELEDGAKPRPQRHAGLSPNERWRDIDCPPNYEELAGFLTGCDFSEYLRDNTLENLWHSLVGRLIPDRDYYQKNASSLIHELFLKCRFEETQLRMYEAPPGRQSTAGGTCAYAGAVADRKRSVGSDPVVLRLVRRLRDVRPSVFFVSMTTDPSPASGLSAAGTWPLGMAVAHRLANVYEWNNDPKKLGWEPGNPWGGWCETSRLLSWFDVRTWAGKNGLNRVTQTLEDNEEKFTFWPREASKNEMSPLLSFLGSEDHGATWEMESRTHPWRSTMKRNDESCIFATAEAGFSRRFHLQVSGKQTNTLQALAAECLPSSFHLSLGPDGAISRDRDGSLACVLKMLQAGDAGRTVHEGKP